MTYWCNVLLLIFLVLHASAMCGRYGQVEFNSETAVNLFVDILEDQSGKKYTSKSDHRFAGSRFGPRR